MRRALGASQSSIRAQFVLEGVLMTSIGGVIGYLLGLLFSSIAAALLPFSVGVDLVTVLISLGVSSLVGLIFSYAPANAASKKEIIEII
nr:ABC transporter permease [Aerococcus urinaeequi]